MVNEFSVKFHELIILCRGNLHYAQELQKKTYDKNVKPKSYTLGDKVWLNKKYIKTT